MYQKNGYQYDKSLKYCPYGTCGAMQFGNGVALKSYGTIVCGGVNGYLFCNGTYSRTTIKHISAFVKEYFPSFSYYTFKRMFEENVVYDMSIRQYVDRDKVEDELIFTPREG